MDPPELVGFFSQMQIPAKKNKTSICNKQFVVDEQLRT